MTTAHDPVEPEERSEIERLIEALGQRSTVVAPDVAVDLIYYLDAEQRRVVTVEVKHHGGEEAAPEREQAEHAIDPLTVTQAVLQALSASKEREMSLTALARAVLERMRDDSVFALADRLDKSVEELEAEREHAAQVEGERGPDDPYEILKVLPEQYHEWFLADYRGALRAAYPAEGFLALTQMLRKWHLRAEQYADPTYQRGLAEARMARAHHERPPGWRTAEEVRQQLREQGRLA